MTLIRVGSFLAIALLLTGCSGVPLVPFI